MFCGLYWMHVRRSHGSDRKFWKVINAKSCDLTLLPFVCLCSGATTVDYCTCTQPRVPLQHQVSMFNTRIVMTGHFSET